MREADKKRTWELRLAGGDPGPDPTWWKDTPLPKPRAAGERVTFEKSKLGKR